ncbi:MAG: hypothetical protein O3C65_04790 [Proteobacteria bacterium]|nr:hypothetical protein [Pseudomonadota bacterium]MDA1057985.1 hypothetical protein [Pseudomonadota bacterium]
MKTLGMMAALAVAASLIALSPAQAACKDDLALVQKELASISDTAKVDAVKKLWGEADTAMKAGDEAACATKVTAAMKEGGIKRAAN